MMTALLDLVVLPSDLTSSPSREEEFMHLVPSLLRTALSFPLFLLLIVVTTILSSLFRVVSIPNAP